MDRILSGTGFTNVRTGESIALSEPAMSVESGELESFVIFNGSIVERVTYVIEDGNAQIRDEAGELHSPSSFGEYLVSRMDAYTEMVGRVQ